MEQIDISVIASNNGCMSTKINVTGRDSESVGDLEAVLSHLMAGTPVESALFRRVRERSERMTDELRRKWGELDVAVDLIREVRDEP